MIHSIYYHNPSIDGFEKLVKHLTRRHFHFISLSDLCDFFNDESKFVKKKRCVFISFDDGWRNNIDLLPIIEKYHVPITIFVSVEPIFSGNFWWEFVEKERGYDKMFEFKKLPYKEFYSSLEQIKNKVGPLKRSAITTSEFQRLAQHHLVTIQSHTVNHPILTSLPKDKLDFELRESKKLLEEMTSCKIYAFSYPNGSLSNREVEVTKLYYDLAFTTEQGNINKDSNPLLLPRYALTGDYYRDLLKMYGIWKHLKKLVSIFR